jgi:hypothetical protein
MSRLFKGFTLNEGYTDLGTLSVDITFVENEVVPQHFQGNEPQVATAPVFLIYDSSKNAPIPNLKVVFTIDEGQGADREIISTQYANKDGFVEFPITPQACVKITDNDANTPIQTQLLGIPANRGEEAYFKVNDTTDYYTMVRNLTYSKGEIVIFDEAAEDYLLFGLGGSNLGGIIITPTGKIYVYDNSSTTWIVKGTLDVYQFSNPAGLTPFVEGFYEESGTSGTLTTGTLGTGTFEQYSLQIMNPSPCKVIIQVDVYEPDGTDPIYSTTLDPLDPETRNITKIEFEYEAPEITDDTPTYAAVATAAGITFSTEFVDFLEENILLTVKDIRSTGPLKYMDGIPDPNAAEVATLQSFVDLYFLTFNLTASAQIIAAGYDSVYKIAMVPRNVFLEDVSAPDAFIYYGSQLHQQAVQRVSLISNVLAASLNDHQLANPVKYAGPDSPAYSVFVPACNCDDCQSGVSPFAYLTDLIKYSAAHIWKTGDSAYTPVNYTSFLTLLKNTFYQPFGDYPVDCETLHEEFCRVRLATEVLQKLYNFLVDLDEIPSAKQAAFNLEKKRYLQLTYNTLLLQIGTSFDEVRSVYIAGSNKEELSAKLANKLGIPLYVPTIGPPALSTDRLWLTFGAGGDHELGEVNLELVFGFRNISRDVLTETPESLMEQWRKIFLNTSWTNADYPLSMYTREDVVPGTPATYKSTWKPIIDPDMIGLDDMRYFADDSVPALYKNRQQNTDAFLTYFVSDTAITSRTSADIINRRVRVVNTNVAGDIIDANKIRLNNGSWISFNLLSKTASGTNVDFQLANGPTEPAMFQPVGTMPTMRYNRLQNVLSNTPDAPSFELELTLAASAADAMSAGYVKLVSTIAGQTAVYDNAVGTPNTNKIDSVTITNEVVLVVFNNGVTFPVSPYLDGLNFIYEKEVPLFTDVIPDPTDVVTDLFTTNKSYNYLAPAAATPNPFEYSVWDPTLDETYAELKARFVEISAGIDITANTTYINNVLHLEVAAFNRMMQIFAICENYLASMYSVNKPTSEELYELASILRTSARFSLNPAWVLEDIEYDPAGGTAYLDLHLTANNFWKSLTEPIEGSWDPSLQTIPATFAEITSQHHPIVDPEYIKETDIVEGPAGQAYRTLLQTRIGVLDAQKTEFLSWIIPHDFDGFTKILNKINQNDATSPYQLPDYADDVNVLADAINSINPFVSEPAVAEAFNAFRMTKADFLDFISTKNKYENENPTLAPSIAQLNNAVDIAVLGYKKLWLYLPATTGWIDEEINGTGGGFKYYNILKMRLAPGRGNDTNRKQWQKTLAEWNGQPVVDPDIVPAENIIHFVAGNIVHDTWVTRLTALEARETALAALFNNSVTLPTLFYNFKDIVCTAIFNDPSGTSSTNPVSLNYFTSLKDREDLGEDIRPRLLQLNTTMSEYRMLRKIYDILALNPSPVPLIQSEYEDVYDIIIHIEKQRANFSAWILEEYDNDGANKILLSGDEFRNYQPAITNYPLTDLPLYNTWRSPFKVRRDWLNTLKTRNERVKTMEDAWKKALIDTEDVSLQVLRDALITAMTKECETFDHAAERLAKTVFIETKDNCCTRHTRISQAIETLQGFIFALKNGIYDEYLAGFELRAPFFSSEWEWLGSYAAWRSAVFVYLFPENILYPTLKRHQSPGFRNLSKSIQENSRLNPEQACLMAQDYEDYFTDILNLDVKFTTTAITTLAKNNVDTCCDDPYYDARVTFFFGQNPNSGKNYWSAKLHDDNSGYGHGFWEELPILRDDAQLVGAFPFAREHDAQGNPKRKELWLFYSFFNEGKLKLAYIKKDLKVAGSRWSDETETDDLPTNSIATGKAVSIIACQSTLDWDWASFIISYTDTFNGGTEGFYCMHIRYFDTDGSFDNTEAALDTSMIYKRHLTQPITALRHSTKPESDISFTPEDKYGYSIVFADYIITRNFVVENGTLNRERIYVPMDPIIGVFKKRDEPNCLIAIYNTYLGVVKAQQIQFTGNTATVVDYNDTTFFTPALEFNHFVKICPQFSIDDGGDAYFAVNGYADVWMASKLTLLEALDLYGITPENSINIPIQSGHCVKDFEDRRIFIQQLFEANMNAPQGTPTGNFLRTPITLEYLYEAYYFVPMLIALDQQQRGQFESALDWYRTIYDYTQNITIKRKIFYGLKLEESISNVFTRTEDWLQDPLNPHLIANTRANAYTRYTITNIAQCLLGYGDREFTTDTVETVPNARKLYTTALELLSIDEINVAENACYITAHCFPASIDFNGTEWQNAFALVQDELGTLSDPTVLNETRTDIIALFVDEELTTPEMFSGAFELIETARAGLVTPPLSIAEVANGAAGRMEVALQFLEANASLGDTTTTFDAGIAASYSTAISRISGLTPSQLNSGTYNASVLQLADADPIISEPYDFEFISSTGVQQMRGSNAYNPLYPTATAFRSNLAFSNTPVQLAGFSRYTPYVDYQFCIPTNPVYNSLKMKANLELFKIHNCMNIAGMQRDLEIYAAPTDSTSGIPIIGANGTLTLPGLNAFRPSQYHFRVLIDRAKQIVGQTQQIEAQFLSAMEKRDAEYYNLMKAKQDLQTAKATIKLQDLRVRQANDEKVISDLQFERATTSFDYFDDLIKIGYNGWEIASIAMLETAVVLQGLAAASYFSAGARELLLLDGNPFEQAGQGFGQLAGTLSTQAGIFSQIASYQRRDEEWRYQLELSEVDKKIANQQIKVSEDNIRIVSQEREISKMNADHANDTLEFLKNKFTNAELYSWMSNVLENVYAYMLNLGTAVARTAEGQLYFERQQPAGPFILDDYWESPSDNYAASATGAGNADRRGLTGSARLLQDIYKLDQYAFDTDKRKLQLTKTISLAQLFPDAFEQFRTTGVLNFQLTNQMFDYDFPGHYLRLIKSVKTNVIGLVPVYGGIKASLTAASTSYVVIGGTTFQQIPINRFANDSVALSSPTNATGLFEMQPLAGEMLNPFEGMGIESSWEFKMPRFSNRMDFDQVADVLVTIEYTALDSFQYRTQVLQQLNNEYSFNRAFSFKNNFPDQWYQLANVEDTIAETFEVSFTTSRADFPAGLELDHIQNLTLFFSRKSEFTEEITIEEFSATIGGNIGAATGNTLNGGWSYATTNGNALGNLVGVINSATPPLLVDPNANSITWKLKFENSITNRELFSQENVTDILFIITCNAILPPYQ